jgi:tetratricopeptide (TPR) repeat protein
MTHSTRRSGALVVVAVVLACLSVAGPAHAGLEDEAARQLELAEADLVDGNFERAAASAQSAFRLDGSLHGALVVRGLALKELGQLDQARGLLTTYLDLRGSLAADERAAPAIVEIERLLAAPADGTDDDEQAGPPPTAVGVFYGPDPAPDFMEEAFAIARPYLDGVPPATVAPLRSAVAGSLEGPVVFGGQARSCGALPAVGFDDALAALDEAAVELEVETILATIADAESALACRPAPPTRDEVLRLLASSALAEWTAGRNDSASAAWIQLFQLDPGRPADTKLPPAAQGLHLQAKADAEGAGGARLDVLLPAGWSLQVDGVAIAGPGARVPAGRRLFRIEPGDGPPIGLLVDLQRGRPALLGTPETLLTSVLGPEPPRTALHWLASGLQQTMDRDGLGRVYLVGQDGDGSSIRSFDGRQLVLLTAPDTRRSGREPTAPRAPTTARASVAPSKVAGPVLMGIGLGVAAMGSVMAGLSHDTGQELLGDMTTPQGFSNNIDRYEQMRAREGAGIGLAAGGGILAVAGVVTVAIPLGPKARKASR